MGDGRYYTANQFFSVVYLTLLLMFMVMCLVMIYYKRNGDKSSRIALISYGLLMFSAFTSMHIEVVFNMNMMTRLSLIRFFSLTSSVILFVVFLYTHRQQLIYKNYVVYNLVVLTGLIVTVLSIYFQHEWARVFLYMTYGLLSLIYNKGIKDTLFFRISDSIFRHVNNRTLDYVFISDQEGRVVYKNRHIIESPYFKAFKFFNESEMGQLFTQDIRLRSAYDKIFIQYKSEPVTYFQFTQKQLINDGAPVGLILTFTDISALIAMLDHLNEKQEETRLSNQALAKHKELVYDIEEEKEITKLLSEIAESQYTSMEGLKKDIDLLMSKEGDMFLEEVVKLIEMGKIQLKDVRNAVSTYRDYYEGRRNQ